MDKVKRIKSWLFVIYFLLLFVPVFKVPTIIGTINVDVSESNAGTFFVLFFIAVTLISLVTVNYLPKYGNIVEYVFAVSVVLMIGFLIIGMTQNNYQFALSFYLQIVVLGVFVTVKFAPDQAIKGYDGLAGVWNKIRETLEGLAPDVGAEEPVAEAPQEPDEVPVEDDDIRYE